MWACMCMCAALGFGGLAFALGHQLSNSPEEEEPE